MSSTIKIGTTSGGMAYLSALSPAIREPLIDPMDYAETIELGDGTRQGQGWLMQNWHWDFVTEAQANKLRTYIGTVYVVTLENDGTTGTYSGTLVWPEKEPEHRSNRVLDLTIELRNLAVVT
jgi:hypothetical protein